MKSDKQLPITKKDISLVVKKLNQSKQKGCSKKKGEQHKSNLNLDQAHYVHDLLFLG